jgi:predicted metal-dependent enzyme (double-stranded beta helix superfamily)
MSENAFVRITELRMSPGDQEPEHQHARGVTVSLTAYDNEITAFPERTVTKRHTDFGEVRWADPSHHSTRNTGTTLQRVIRVELKQEPGPQPTAPNPLDSAVVSKDTQRVLLENSYVRVIEELVPPGVTQPRHNHRRSVLVVLADGDLEVLNDGATTPGRPHVQVGQANWQEASIHTAKNPGTTTLRNIRIEVK